jgi:hypothetical protein
MHRAPFAFVVPRGFSIQFGHGFIETGAFGYEVTMASMSAGDLVILSESSAYSCGYCFFADVRMQESRDFPPGV